MEVDGVDDVEEFAEVRRAMEALSFTKTEMEDIFSICAGVLHLGNLTFQQTGDRASKIQASSALDNAASLLQVAKDKLEQVCVTRRMQVTGQQPITIGLGAEEAKAARDALSKFLYEKLFDWLVERINKSIGLGGGQKGRTIGILDIFGFEIFKVSQAVPL
jgi:myosin heavy subunit